MKKSNTSNASNANAGTTAAAGAAAPVAAPAAIVPGPAGAVAGAPGSAPILLNILDEQNELQKLEQQIAQRKQTIELARRDRLSKLHTELGLGSTIDLINELKRINNGAGVGSTGAARSGGGRRKVDDAMREKIKSMVNDGKTGKDIAKSLGISVPTVQNVKSDLGLVRSRSS
jgi:type II secretory pathway pseudopilin PulG